MSIAHTAARGVAWNMVLGIGSRMLQLIGTLILTRFIAPEAYGAVLAASITVTVAGTLTSFAFGQYLMAQKSSAEISFQATVIHVALGVVTMAIVIALRDPMSDWVGSPGMAEFVPGFVVVHLLERIRYVPERLVMRELRFRAIATINGAAELLFTAVALSLAVKYGAYSIMYASLARALLTTGLFLAVSPREHWLRPCAFHGPTVRALFGYGIPVMLTSIADRATTRLDSLLMSRLFGPAVMARYNLSYSLAEAPITNIAGHIGEVLMPSFSRMTESERQPAVVKSAAMMTLVVSPFAVGLGAVAPTLVSAFFDARWAGISQMLVILSVMTLFRPIAWPAVAYLQAVGRTRLLMWLSIIRACVVLSLIAGLGAIGGPLWACIGACIGYASHSLLVVVAAGLATGMPARPYLAGVTPPLLACIPMFIATLALGSRLEAMHLPSLVTLIAQTIAGACVYGLAAVLLAGPTVRALMKLATSTIRRASPSRSSREPDCSNAEDEPHMSRSMPIAIDRRANLSLQEFESRYAARCLPVILTDATAHWPALGKWDLDYFASRFADKQVHFDNRTWQIGPFISQLKSGTAQGPVPYLKMVKLDEQFPELRTDVGDLALARHNRLQSRFLPRSMQIERGTVAVFVGTKGSGFRTLHWDLGYLHVFISQILGDKEFIVFRPQDTPYLYASAEFENLSVLPDPFNVDLQAFPEFARAQPIRITVKQGETLFLPGGWWHATYIDQPNIAIAESTLDHFNWRQRKDWYMDRYRRAGVPALKRQLLNLYLNVVERLI